MTHPRSGFAAPPQGGAACGLAEPAPRRLLGKTRLPLVLSIFKLRIAVLIMVTALGGMAITPGAGLNALQVLVLAVSVLAASAAAGAFNQYAEAETDRLMKRTRSRPFASGALKAGPAWLAAIVTLLAAAIGASALWVNVAAALYTLAGALTYALLYTLALKRRTAWNIVVGGLAGSFAVLAGAAAVNPSLGPLPLLLALVLFLWTPPHFWSLAIAGSADYEAAGVPMLPVVVGVPRAARIVHANAVGLVAVSLLPVFFGAGAVYLAGALLGGIYFVSKTRALARAPERKTAFAAFFASMVQLSVLLAAVVVDAALR